MDVSVTNKEICIHTFLGWSGHIGNKREGEKQRKKNEKGGGEERKRERERERERERKGRIIHPNQQSHLQQ